MRKLRWLVYPAALVIAFLLGQEWSDSRTAAVDAPPLYAVERAAVGRHIQVSTGLLVSSLGDIPRSITYAGPDTITLNLEYDPRQDSLDPVALHDEVYRVVFLSDLAVPELKQGRYVFRVHSFDHGGKTVLDTQVRNWEAWDPDRARRGELPGHTNQSER